MSSIPSIFDPGFDKSGDIMIIVSSLLYVIKESMSYSMKQNNREWETGSFNAYRQAGLKWCVQSLCKVVFVSLGCFICRFALRSWSRDTSAVWLVELVPHFLALVILIQAILSLARLLASRLAWAVESAIDEAHTCITVKTESDIQKAIVQAIAEGKKLRVCAARLSDPRVRDMNGAGIILNVAQYNQVISLDKETREITVQAGIRLGDFQDFIHSHQLATSAVVGTSNITVGGALITGSQDGSCKYLRSTDVVEMRYITGTGEVKVVRRGDKDFGAFVCSVGMLGVLSTLTLQCQPAYNLRGVSEFCPFNQMLTLFRSLNNPDKEQRRVPWGRESVPGETSQPVDYIRVLFYGDWCHVLRTIRTEEVSVPYKEPVYDKPHALLAHGLLFLASRLNFRWFHNLSLALWSTLTLHNSEFSGPWKDVGMTDKYNHNTWLPLYYWEVVVDGSKIETFLHQVQELFKRPNVVPLLIPIIIDPLLSDTDALIAKNSSSDPSKMFFCVTIGIGFEEYMPRPLGTVYRSGVEDANTLSSWDVVELIFDIGKNLNARMHWGKGPWIETKDQLRNSLDIGQLDKFCAVRERCDPHNLFMTPHLQKLFAPPTAPAVDEHPVATWYEPPMGPARKFLLDIVTHPLSDQCIAWIQHVTGAHNTGVRNSFWYNFFTMASMLGDEGNFLVALVVWMSVQSANRFNTCFGIICVLGQLLKDVLCLPRPVASTSIIKLNDNFSNEHGLPSTHVMNLCLPFCFLLILLEDGVSVDGYWWHCAAVVLASVSVSRLYLAAHSVADVVAGLLLGGALTLLCRTEAVRMVAEGVVYNNPNRLKLDGVLTFLFCTLYPGDRFWKQGFSTATQFFATYIALDTALYYAQFCQPEIWQELVFSSSIGSAQPARIAVRIFMGFAVSIVCHELASAVVRAVLLSLLQRGMIGDCAAFDREGNAVVPKHRYCIDIPVSFARLFAQAWGVAVLTPQLWVRFGL